MTGAPKHSLLPILLPQALNVISSQSDYFSFVSLGSHYWLFTFVCQLQGKESKSGDIFNSNAGAGEREKCNYWKRCFCEGAVIYILNRCKLSSLPTPKFRKCTPYSISCCWDFFSCSLWFSAKIRKLWFSERYEGVGYLWAQEVVTLSQQWNICRLKRRSLTRARCWTYNSSLLEWKRKELFVCWFWILHGGLPATVNLCIIVLSDRINGNENLPAQPQTFHHTVIIVIKFSGSYSPLQKQILPTQTRERMDFCKMVLY